ncbi:TRAP transporter permease [Thermodesulfobacteriota bacterium]
MNIIKGMGNYYAGSKRVLEKNYLGRSISAFAVAFSLYHLWTLSWGSYDLLVHRAIHLCAIMSLCFLTYAASRRRAQRLPKRDTFMALMSLVVMVYVIVNLERLTVRASMADPVTMPDIFFGILFILLLLEVSRRSIGIPMVLIALFFLCYCYFGSYLSGLLGHPGLSIPLIIDTMFLSMDGIWGVPIGVGSTFVFLFVLFGQILLQTGGGKFFRDLAFALAGRSVGGPAKISVIASGFFGTMSGSPTANVMTTGSMTIPTMKQAGYSPAFAGGVEAAASTGGNIMPPVMGSVAFLLAEIAGIEYLKVCIAAFLPAVLYFLAIYAMVHFEALKMGLGRTGTERVPRIGQVLKEGGHFLLPLIVIIGALIMGYSPTVAALRGMAATVLVALIREKNRKGLWKKVLISLEKAPMIAIVVSTGMGCSGIIIGTLFYTGMGGKFTSLVLQASGSYLAPLLVLSMVACIILGMGVSVSASYILTALIVVPAAIKVGVLPIAAHLFAAYFAVMSFITPPVALAAYAAAGIAEADPFKVGLYASRLGIIGFIIPYMFVYQPALLFVGSAGEILLAVVTAIFGIVALAAGFEGWLRVRANIFERALLIVGGIILAYPGWSSDLMGGGLMLAAVISQYTRIKLGWAPVPERIE